MDASFAQHLTYFWGMPLFKGPEAMLGVYLRPNKEVTNT
jgi:hypothetical protein